MRNNGHQHQAYVADIANIADAANVADPSGASEKFTTSCLGKCLDLLHDTGSRLYVFTLNVAGSTRPPLNDSYPCAPRPRP